MIAISEGAVTRLIPESTRVIDLLLQYGRMPVYRKSPAMRTGADKPVTPQEQLNARRQAEYAQRLHGQKPAALQLWRAP